MPLGVRTIKKIKDGSIRRVTEGVAANMVSKGLYEYADDGPDQSEVFKKANQRTLDKLEKRPTPTVDFNKDLSAVRNPINNPLPTSPKRIKKDTVAKEKMEMIKAINKAQPAQALNMQGDEFSKAIKSAQHELKNRQTKIPIKTPTA